MLDLFANPLGVVATNGDEMQIGVDPRVTMIYATGSATATTGFAWRNQGQLTLLYWAP